MMVSKYTDQYGLVHCEPNEISENGALFTAEYFILVSMLYGLNHLDRYLIAKILASLFNWSTLNWKDRGGEAGNHVSHDNFLGVYALGKLAGTSPWGLHSGLEKHETDPSFFYHPKDIGTFAIVEGKWWGLLLLPLMLIQWVWSLTSKKEETSGRILWLVRWWMVSRLMMKLHIAIINRQYKSGFTDVFAIYFKHEDHPINTLARKLWP